MQSPKKTEIQHRGLDPAVTHGEASPLVRPLSADLHAGPSHPRPRPISKPSPSPADSYDPIFPHHGHKCSPSPSTQWIPPQAHTAIPNGAPQ